MLPFVWLPEFWLPNQPVLFCLCSQCETENARQFRKSQNGQHTQFKLTNLVNMPLSSYWAVGEHYRSTT